MTRQPSVIAFNKRESHTRVPRRKYHVIFEGRTEMDYFDCLKDSGLLCDNLFFFKIAKKGIEQDMSDRMEMISSAYDYMLFIHEGKSTLRRYLAVELSDFYIQERDVVGKSYKEFRNELLDLRLEMLKHYRNHESIHEGLVDSETNLHRVIAAELSQRYHVDYKMGNTDSFTSYKRPRDDSEKVFVVFDRDYNEEHFNHVMYQECIRKCEELGYFPIVTSPKFELWLLMHHKDADFAKPTFYPSYGRHISWELVKCGDSDSMPESRTEKIISRERFDNHYRAGIITAIEKAKDKSLFVTGAVNLMDRPGTDLGGLVDSILDKSKL